MPSRSFAAVSCTALPGFPRSTLIRCGVSVYRLQWIPYVSMLRWTEHAVICSPKSGRNTETPAGTFSCYPGRFYFLQNSVFITDFDTNWYACLFDEAKRRAYEADRLNVTRMGSRFSQSAFQCKRRSDPRSPGSQVHPCAGKGHNFPDFSICSRCDSDNNRSGSD